MRVSFHRSLSSPSRMPCLISLLTRLTPTTTVIMKPHAFVAMPFGSKPGPDGQLIDFNRVYTEYIQTALEAAGMEVFRADQEQRAGDIITDMFQELLVA